ncbi:MAG TPA: hypothetical protein VGM05_26920, partial [Planctomycetaceae bacterium]
MNRPEIRMILDVNSGALKPGYISPTTGRPVFQDEYGRPLSEGPPPREKTVVSRHLTGLIDAKAADRFIADLCGIPKRPDLLRIFVDTVGGEITSACDIGEALMDTEARRVVTICNGRAYS